jgi:hypothetical protein
MQEKERAMIELTEEQRRAMEQAEDEVEQSAWADAVEDARSNLVNE